MATGYGPFNGFNDGSTAGKAAPCALAIKAINPSAADGVYWINLPGVGPKQTYCIMSSSYDGGGWMMAMKATRGTTFQYDSTYWTAVNTLNPTQTNQNDGDAKFDVMNYYPAKDMLARWPDITTSNGGSITGLGAHIWLQNNITGSHSLGTLASGVDNGRITPIRFFSGSSKLFIKDAKTYDGWQSGIFSSQSDVRFYGFNFLNTPAWAGSRWGFGWNENGGGLYPNGDMGSDDVFGGIGMKTITWGSGTNGYSAGDAISCCQDSTGLNRSARVEVYIR